MQPYYSLIFGFLLAFGSAFVISGAITWLRTGRKVRISLCRDLISLSALKDRLAPGFLYWALVVLVSLFVVVSLAVLSYYWLYYGFEIEFLGSWWYDNVIESWGRYDFRGDDYRVVPFGALGAIFAGLLIGAGLGSAIARRQATSRILVTSRLHKPANI